ncbi:MAG: nuclear transport factor 2 family protein [Halioglobus sp.]|nr:nuclear transport factor 2 family protein [Halioglobus sp.]
MQNSTNKQLVDAFFDALNRGDVEYIVNAYADDGCVQTMGNTLISGVFNRDQIAASAGGIFEVFPAGLKFTALAMVAEGDKVAVEATSEGLHVSGRTYSNDYHFLFQFRDGKLLRLKEYMDTERVTDVLCAGQRPPTDHR